MKLSMETMYFPEAKFHHKKEMMADWVNTSEKASAFSWVAVAVCVVASLTSLALKDTFFFIYLGCAAMFTVSALLCKKWLYPAYLAVFAGEMLSLLRFYIEVPESKAILGIAVMVATIGVAPAFFAYRCIFNYRSVFKELEKSEGFPNFIANTADLYAEKIYLQDEEETVFENIAEASYNPFNTAEDVQKEEFRRYQEARIENASEPKRMDIDVNGRLVSEEEQRSRREAKEKAEKKGGLFIGSYELIFAHDDLYDDDYDQKRTFMGKWRENVEGATSNFHMFAFILAMAVMASGFGTVMGILNFAVIIVFIIATNHMKMGRWYAPITMLVAVAYSVTLANSAISTFLLACAYIIGFRMFTGVIRYILNYKSYKILSKQTGFPTFIRTTADLYADRMYIVEKREPLKKKDPSQRVVRVMDIGYDSEPKKDEGAWNAFNYMDEQKEKDDSNES